VRHHVDTGGAAHAHDDSNRIHDDEGHDAEGHEDDDGDRARGADDDAHEEGEAARWDADVDDNADINAHVDAGIDTDPRPHRGTGDTCAPARRHRGRRTRCSGEISNSVNPHFSWIT
jgi:hypothetical protein